MFTGGRKKEKGETEKDQGEKGTMNRKVWHEEYGCKEGKEKNDKRERVNDS